MEQSSVKSFTLDLVYERSGGIAGFHHRLEVQGDSLHAFKRREQVAHRQLSEVELQALQALVDAAKRAATPEDSAAARQASDHFSLNIRLGRNDPPTLSIHRLALPGETPDGTAWGNLLAYCEMLLNRSLGTTPIVID